jgi:hypothetical protein
MTYRITGLDPSPYRPLFDLSDQELASRCIVRMTVTQKPGFPCRVTLEDREVGEQVLLVNHVSQEDGPYRASHAIFVSDGTPAGFVDEVPPVFNGRVLSLRAFDHEGMMVDAALAQPGEADAVIRSLLANELVDHIDAHNATRGCFSARIERPSAQERQGQMVSQGNCNV